MIRGLWFDLKMLVHGFFHPRAHALDKDAWFARQMDRWDNGQW